MWFEQHITRYDSVQGGHPVVVGTRTPVRTVAILFHEVYPGDVAEVHRSLPHLTQEQVEAALAYYDAHRAEIDADIERHEQAAQAFLLTQ